jgi:hypothetical protein
LLLLLLCCLQAKGPTGYANNAAFVQEYVCSLLASSFPNMTPVQIQAAVAGMMAIEDKRAFKHHMRDFLVQVRPRCWLCVCVLLGMCVPCCKFRVSTRSQRASSIHAHFMLQCHHCSWAD